MPNPPPKYPLQPTQPTKTNPKIVIRIGTHLRSTATVLLPIGATYG